jgi:putative DNA primase/helicase
MLAETRWVAWRYETRDGNPKPTKVPVDPHTGERASTTDPKTWGTYAKATMRAAKGNLAGVGFVLGDGWLGIDFDNYREKSSGYLMAPVPSVVESFGTYAEVSPSKTGVKIIGRGRMPEGVRNRTGKNEMGQEIEVYEDARFFTVTGFKLDAAPATVGEMPEEFEAFCRKFLPERNAQNGHPKRGADGAGSLLSDHEVISILQSGDGERGQRVRALWDGDTSGYGGDHSRADAALINEIVYYAGGDLDKADRVFRQSGLYRPKWERVDYRKRTFDLALNGRGPDDFYRPNSHGPNGHGPNGQGGPGVPKSRPLTDVGNAERLAARIEGKAVYVYEAKGWYVYTGKRWEPDTTGEVYRAAVVTARAILHEAAEAPGKEQREKIIKWSRQSESKTRIDAMVQLSATVKGMTVSATIFDTDPYLLACNNGTLDLRTGELRKSKPKDYITKLAPVKWQGRKAPAPRWDAFLSEIIEDGEIRDFLRVAAGYGATGLSNARAFFICHGSGRNGKGTYLETVRAVLGDYGHTAKAETFLVARREGGQASTDVADLKGTRLVITSESRPGAKIDANLIKSLTGDDTINARHLFQRAIQFKPSWSVFLATNHRPEMPGDDIALWERVKLIPFDVRISDEQKDTGLKAKLMAEAPGILAWIVSGAEEYIESGLTDPEGVKAATAQYQAESDPIGGFIGRYLNVRPGDDRYYVTTTDLRNAWNAYREEEEEADGIEYKAISKRLKAQHGSTMIVSKSKTIDRKSTRVWYGFSLTDEGENLAETWAERYSTIY